MERYMNKLIVFIALATIVGCKSESDDRGLVVDPVIPVAVVSLETGESRTVIEATGVFTTENETLLSFKNGGVIERVYVKEGDRIRKGQVLASLNNAEMNARTAQARSALEKARRDYERARQLYRDSVATREQMENAKTALDVVQEDWKTIQINQGYSEIKASTDGYVLMKMANEGQVVGPGMPVLQVSGESAGNWVVKAGVSDRQWAAIKKGDVAIIEADAFDNPVDATVVRKTEMVDPASGTFQIYVKPVASGKLPIATGMFARVKLQQKHSGAWPVPHEALLDGEGENASVFVTDDLQTAKRVNVKVGSIESDRVMVVSGLDGHEYLIVSGSPYLKEGSKINVVKK